MKLELKHLAGYLPYGLKGKVTDFEENENWYDEIERVCFRDNILSFKDAIDVYLEEPNETVFYPILRPLSDLTKEIDVNGEKIVPLEVLLDIEAQMNWSCSDYLVPESGLNEWWVGLKEKPYYTFGYNKYKGFYMLNKFSESQIVNNQNKLWQKLFEWHFDLYSLIENNLAININNIK